MQEELFKKQEEIRLENASLEKMAEEDREYISFFETNQVQEFKYDSSKTVARNYRDYEIYKAMKGTENEPYGELSDAAKYIQRKAAVSSGAEKIEKRLLNLCSNTFMKKVGNEEIRILAEHLMCGLNFKDEENPNEKLQEEMRSIGEKALKELYTRQIIQIDKKYGKKLVEMSSADYLKKKAEIDHDLSCLKDMEEFFKETIDEEAATDMDKLLIKKASYYLDVMSLLSYRTKIYVDGGVKNIDKKGELSANHKKVIDTFKKNIQNAAKEKDTFAKISRKDENLKKIFLSTDERKSRALEAISRTEKKEADKQKAIEEAEAKRNELRAMLSYYTSYRNAVASYEQEKDEKKKAAKMKEIKFYLAKKVVTDENEIARIQREADDLDSIIRETDGQIDTVSFNDENAISQMDMVEEKYQHFRKGMMLGDDEFIEKYPELIEEYDVVLSSVQNVTHDKYFDRLQEEFKDKKLEELPDTLRARNYKRFKEFRLSAGNGDGLSNKGPAYMTARIERIIKHGYTEGSKLYEDEIILDKENSVAQELINAREEKKAVLEVRDRSLNEMKADLTIPDFSHKNFDEKGIFELLNTISEIRHYKEEYPDMYRLGQAFDEYQKCEFYLQNEELIRETFMLRLKLLHLNDDFQFEQVKSGYDEYLARYNRNIDSLGAVFAAVDNLLLISDEKSSRVGICKGQIKKELSAYKGKEESIKETLLKLKVDGTLVYSIILENGMGFLSMLPEEKDASYSLAKESLLTDVEAVTDVLKYSMKKDLHEEIKEEDIPYEQALRLVESFTIRVDNLMDKLEAEGEYSDRGFVNSRSEIEEVSLMADLLKRKIGDSGLGIKMIEKYSQVPGFDLQIDKIKTLDKTLNKLNTFRDYSNHLYLNQIKNDYDDVSMLDGNEFKKLNKAEMQALSEQLRTRSKGTIDEFRINFKENSHKEEIREVEKKAFIARAVGREIIASQRRSDFASVASLIDWLGNRIGAPLQVLSWVLHEKRTDNHGAVRYDECKKLYDEKLGMIPDMTIGKLPSYYRDTRAIAPEVELDKYFSSDMKKSILAALEAERDSDANILEKLEVDEFETDFNKAVEAIEYYGKVVGIVNSDTTEMEMAFIDTFKKSMAKYIERWTEEKGGSLSEQDRQKIQDRIAFLQRLDTLFTDSTRGMLSDTLDEDVLKEISENTISYVEDTLFSENMEESNIKDIPLFLHEPNINDIKQSSIGDCWLVSAISAVVNTNPDFIRSMFHDLGDGNVLVRLYMPVDDKTEESAKSKYDMLKENYKMVPTYFKLRKQYETGYGNASDCSWVQLLEKAYALGGFNGRNEVVAKDGKLYNVADELTMGQINLAMKVITGKTVRYVPCDKDIEEKEIYSDFMIDGLTAGLDNLEFMTVCTELDRLKRAHDGADSDTQIKYSYMALENYFLKTARDRIIESLVDGEEELKNALSKKGITEEEKDRIKAARIKSILEKIKNNIELMMDGKELEFTDMQEAARKEQQDSLVNGEENSMVLYNRQKYATYFYDVRRKDHGTDSSFQSFIKNVEYCIRKKGTVGIAIPHCVNIIDVKWYNGDCFMLMRDPFNIYNVSYGLDEKNKLTRTSEEFGSVITKRQENRRLIGDKPEDIIKAGFRGTSWYLASDLFVRFAGADMMLPEYLGIPDHHIR